MSRKHQKPTQGDAVSHDPLGDLSDDNQSVLTEIAALHGVSVSARQGVLALEHAQPKKKHAKAPAAPTSRNAPKPQVNTATFYFNSFFQCTTESKSTCLREELPMSLNQPETRFVS